MPTPYEAVRDYIVETSGVTVVEILGVLEAQGVETDGDLVVYYPYESIVMWAGVSQEVLDVLSKLVVDPAVDVVTTPPMTYYIDGQVPRLKVANLNAIKRRHQYKEDRWLPVAFNRNR